MKYSDISQNVLNEIIELDYDGYPISLQEEIDAALERTGDKHIVDYGYTKDTSGYIKTFGMQSENYSYALVDTPVIGKMLLATKIKPTEENHDVQAIPQNN